MIGGLLNRFRLLPAVLVVGSFLFVLKTAGLVMDAQADTSSPAQTSMQSSAPQATAVTVSNDPASDNSVGDSASEVGVLTNLSKRRMQLDAQQQGLTTRENLLAAAEKRVDDKIAKLQALQVQIVQLLVQRDTAEQKQLDALVKTYSSMKPKDAARIFNNLDDTVLMNVTAAMKPDILGAILAQMQAENAQKLTVRLANRLKADQQQSAAPANAAMAQPAMQTSQQIAALAPAITPAASQSVPAPAPTPAPTKTVSKMAAPLPTPASIPQSAPAKTAMTMPAETKPQAVTPSASVPATPAPLPAAVPAVGTSAISAKAKGN